MTSIEASALAATILSRRWYCWSVYQRNPIDAFSDLSQGSCQFFHDLRYRIHLNCTQNDEPISMADQFKISVHTTPTIRPMITHTLAVCCWERMLPRMPRDFELVCHGDWLIVLSAVQNLCAYNSHYPADDYPYPSCLLLGTDATEDALHMYVAGALGSYE